jgi:CheY-like chemotaxis protein
MENQKAFVLVAEDDTSTRASLVEFLTSNGHEAAGVRNGAELLRRISEKPRPDLIILDLVMPVVSGWEVLAVREANPAFLLIPVIVISGEVQAPPEIGPTAFLPKPVRLERLRVVINEILEQPDPQRAPRRSEPWSVDRVNQNLIRNSFGHVVAFVASAREARRIIAAVNGASQLSTQALEQGIIDKGLECLYDLNRYEVDADYRKQLDETNGRDSIQARRREVASMLEMMSFTPRAQSAH